MHAEAIELRGTTDCPICGVGTPHRHTEKEENLYRRRQMFSNRVLALLTTERDFAVQQLERFEEGCKTCRFMYDGFARRLGNGICVPEYGMRQEGDKYFCPDCNRFVWSNES